MDIKDISNKKYKYYTSISKRQILDNIKKMATLNRTVVIRVPIIQKFNDSRGILWSLSRYK